MIRNDGVHPSHCGSRRVVPGWRLLAGAAALLSASLAPAAVQDLTASEARAIAREAYVFGYPMVQTYRELHRQAVAPGPFFRAPFQQFDHDDGAATSKDIQFPWPNADTSLTTLWLDLRAEPVVLTLPPVENDRYVIVQLVDLHAFNAAYLGTRTMGVEGGDFLIAGPGWQGEKPEAVRDVVRCESQFAGVFIRIHQRGPADRDRVREIQGGLRVRPLSDSLGEAVVPAVPPPAWLAPRIDMTDGLRLFPYVNFLLPFCDPHPADAERLARFSRLGIGPGLQFDPSAWPAAVRQAAIDGIAEVWSKDFPEVMERLRRGELTADECFGSREFFIGDIIKRAIGARIGLHGQSREEVMYTAYFADAERQPMNAATTRYTIRFEKDQLPPSAAFWSLTLYDADTHLLVPNRLQRYGVNSTMLESLTFAEDGSLTLYLQHEPPGKNREANWLPAPSGRFHCLLRLHHPKPEALTKKWIAPALQRLTR